MRYPVPSNRRALIFWPMLAATLALIALMPRTLTTAAAPRGIISFELAGSEERARAIVEAWDAGARRDAGFSLRIDFLFLIAYSTTISLACAWAADALRARGWALAAVGVPLAWAQWLAALFDATENIALLRLLGGPVASPWPQIAWGCAIVKFVLVGLGLLYFVVGATAWLPGRLAPGRGQGSATRRSG